jgi:hypothetical protein
VEKCLIEIKSKIHDQLLKELLKQDDNGKFSNLIKLVLREDFSVKCSVDLRNGKGCVDVVLTYPRPIHYIKPDEILVLPREDAPKPTAFELITDVNFDVGKKLEQLNRYKVEYDDTRAIIPEEYKREYLPLFHVNGILVHTWKGTRRWRCKNCKAISELEGSTTPPSSCGSDSCKSNQFEFVGLKNVEFR